MECSFFIHKKCRVGWGMLPKPENGGCALEQLPNRYQQSIYNTTNTTSNIYLIINEWATIFGHL